MGRNKHSIAKTISPTDPTQSQLQIARLGDLHHMSEEADAVRTILSERPTRCFWRSGISPDEFTCRQLIADALMYAVHEMNPKYFRDFADVLEVIGAGRDISPIDGFLIRLKSNKEEPPEEGHISGFFDAWPFTISKIRDLCREWIGSDCSTETIRAAAIRVGIPYKEGRGRPRKAHSPG